MASLDHLKPRTFFVAQPFWSTWNASLLQNLWIHPCSTHIHSLKVNNKNMGAKHDISSKLIIKKLKWINWLLSNIIIVNFENFFVFLVFEQLNADWVTLSTNVHKNIFFFQLNWLRIFFLLLKLYSFHWVEITNCFISTQDTF